MTQAPISENDAPFALLALERMMFIRAFEKACWDLSAGAQPAIIGSIHKFAVCADHSIHPCHGQEAVPVGTCAALRTRTRSSRLTAATDAPSRQTFRRPQFSARFAIDNQASMVGGLAHLKWRRQNEQQYRGSSCDPLMSSL